MTPSRQTWAKGRWSTIAAAALLATGGWLAVRSAHSDSFFYMEIACFISGLQRWIGPAWVRILPQGLELVPKVYAASAYWHRLPLDFHDPTGTLGPDLARLWTSHTEFMDRFGRELWPELFRARLITIAAWIAGGWLLWLTVRCFRPAVALAVLGVWSLSPTFISWSSRISTDMMVAVLLLASAGMISWYARKPTCGLAMAAGAMLGVAIAGKLTAVAAVPAWLAVACLRARHASTSWPKHLLSVCIHLGLGIVALWVVILFIHGPPIGRRLETVEWSSLAMRQAVLAARSMDGYLLRTVLAGLPETLLQGMDSQWFVFERSDFLCRVLGRDHFGGSRWYYVATLVLKEPVGLVPVYALGFLAAAGLLVLSGLDRRYLWLLPFAMTTLLVFGIASLALGYQDYRYIVPALACSLPCAARVLHGLGRAGASLGVILVVAGVAEGLAAGPDFAGFVNAAAGALGPPHGVVDWRTVCRSQNLIRLQEWLRQHPEAQPLHLAVTFAPVPPRLYGLPQRYANVSDAPTPVFQMGHGGPMLLGRPAPGWYAVETALLYHWPPPISQPSPPPQNYFSSLRPVARIGRTIAIYRIPPSSGATQRRPAASGFVEQPATGDR